MKSYFKDRVDQWMFRPTRMGKIGGNGHLIDKNLAQAKGR